MLKGISHDSWRFRCLTWAASCLEVRRECALRSRIEAMRKVARKPRSHQELILNGFRAKGKISSGPVGGLNKRIRVIHTRRSYDLHGVG